MLVLNRKSDQALWIGDDIRVLIVEVKAQYVRVGIEAPEHIGIERDELRHAKKSSIPISAQKGKRYREVYEYIGKAAFHRQQLEKLARDFAAMHNEAPGSCEADELMHVILDGFEYGEAVERILDIKLQKQRSHQTP